MRGSRLLGQCVCERVSITRHCMCSLFLCLAPTLAGVFPVFVCLVAADLKTQQVLHTFRQWGLCQHGPVNFPLASADCVQRIPEIKMPVRSADVWEESSLPENLTVPEVLDGGKTTVNSVLLIGSLEQLTVCAPFAP